MAQRLSCVTSVLRKTDYFAGETRDRNKEGRQSVVAVETATNNAGAAEPANAKLCSIEGGRTRTNEKQKAGSSSPLAKDARGSLGMTAHGGEIRGGEFSGSEPPYS